MLGSLVIRLLAELVVESLGTMRRSFDSEMDRYFKDRNFRSARPEPQNTR
jgi:hypothetical protein